MSREVVVQADGRRLGGSLAVPEAARGIVLFAHGSGSSRHSPRNRHVARRLESAGFATLLMDLLEDSEEADRRNVFDVQLLAERLLYAVEWVGSEPDLATLPLGYFGASTGAAAALIAGARNPSRVTAIVSRGGRPDLAGRWLGQVKAPTLLIVGGHDEEVLELNRAALANLRGEKELVIVPGATHLFEEPGALDRVADLAMGWFGLRLPRGVHV